MKQYTHGLYCSRDYAQWMIRKNRQSSDYPATSYHRLVRLFSITNYKEFFDEEERKGNEFYYNLKTEGESVMLERPYDLVYLSYRSIIKDVIDDCDSSEEPEPVDEFILGYRILQTRGYMPGSPGSVFDIHDYYSMNYIVDEIVGRANHWRREFKKDKDVNITEILEQGKGHVLGYNAAFPDAKFDDVYHADDFREAEARDFIDNDWAYSFGPSCPDRIICVQMYGRVICQFMKEVDRLDLAGDREGEFYELRVAAYVAAILHFAKDKSFRLSSRLEMGMLKDKAAELYENYCRSAEQDLNTICKKIRIGLLWDVHIVVDRSHSPFDDYDYRGFKEPPIGLTAEDYEELNMLSCEKERMKSGKDEEYYAELEDDDYDYEEDDDWDDWDDWD